MEKYVEWVTRAIKLVCCVVVAAVVFWRTQTASSSSLLPSVMGGIFAILVVFLGLGLAAGSEEGRGEASSD